MEEKNVEEIAEYRVLLVGGEGEIIEKRSRFIATIRPVSTEEEATAFIEEIKKKYWDARHNCSAFVIGKRAELTRCSDDGEPSGTAGRPMLEVLLGEKIRNIAVVVTRYFGGTLLGTGGLVRAYTQAVKEGIDNCSVGRMRYGMNLELQTDYSGIGKIQYILAGHGIAITDSVYGVDVVLKIVVPNEDVTGLLKELTEACNGRVKINELDKIYYVDKEEMHG